MTNPIVIAAAQGYVDPNRLDQGYAFSQTVIIPTMPSTIHGKIPKVDDTGKLVLDNSIYDSIKIKDIPMLQLNEAGHVTGLGLGEEMQRMLVTPKEDGVYARGEQPTFVHMDELPYIKDIDTKEPEGLAEAVEKQALKTVQGNRAQRRKAAAVKKKAAPKHVVNTKKANIKAALGAVILNKLGGIQRDTTDAVKREVLRDLPLSDFVEAVTGKTLPEYQKRLLDLQQARAEGTLKPELESLGTQAPRLEAETTIQ